MPIRPENRDRYPADWKEIRERILTRAGQVRDESGLVTTEARCEQCSARNHVYGFWEGDAFHELDGEPTQQWDALALDGIRTLQIVLTIAHLDHTPENCSEDNLRAWCQRCHNSYDMPTRARGRRERLEAEAGQLSLLE